MYVPALQVASPLDSSNPSMDRIWEGAHHQGPAAHHSFPQHRELQIHRKERINNASPRRWWPWMAMALAL